MSTDIRGSTVLPEVYQIKCPSPTPTDWKSLIAKATTDSRTSGGNSGYWYKITKQNWKVNSKAPYADIPEISYEEWKRLISGIGDYSIEAIKRKKIVIHCLTQELWDKVWPICNRKDYSRIWEYNREKSCINPNSSYSDKSYYEKDSYQIISAEEFIRANQPVEQSYKADRWVVILNSGRSYTTHGDINYQRGTANDTYNQSAPLNKPLQVHSECGNSIWKLVDGNRWYYYNLSSSANSSKYWREATPEEIRQAGGIQDEWRVGDKLPVEWLKKTHVHSGKNGVQQSLKTYWEKDQKVSEVSEGWAKIGDTRAWLPPKHTCTPLPSTGVQQVSQQHSEVTVPGTNIGRRVKIVNGYTNPGGETTEYVGKIGIVEVDKDTLLKVRFSDGNLRDVWTPDHGEYNECEWADNEVSKPINNNQTKNNKQDEYRKQQHTGKRSRWDIILPDSEEPIVSRSGGRTGTAGYSRGELPAIKCGYKGVGKGIKGGQEITY